MDFSEVARTCFAARDFTNEAIPDHALYRILEHARFAPSGGNRQGWRVIVVRDPAARRRLADLCVPTFQRYLAQMRAGENPWNTIVPTQVSDADIDKVVVDFPLLNHIESVPVMLVVAVDLRVVASFDRDLPRVGVISGASVYPFVWSLLLAARNEGYGGVLTTFLAGSEQAVQKELGLPDYCAVAAMVPLGRPVKQLTKLTRKPVEEFATLDRFDGEAFTAKG